MCTLYKCFLGFQFVSSGYYRRNLLREAKEMHLLAGMSRNSKMIQFYKT